MVIIRTIFACLLTLFAAASSSLASPAKFRVGAILGLSGEVAIYGRAAQNGMRMALDGLSSEDKGRLEIIYEDDGMQSPRAVSAYRKLVNHDRVNAVICWSSSSCKAIAPLAERSEIPLIAIASDAAVSKGRTYAFNFWVTPEVESELLISEAVARGYKKVAAVSTIHEGALACRDAFVNAAKGKLEIVYDENFPPDTKDFRTNISRIASAKPDAVMLSLMPGHIGVFAKQLREAGVTAPIFGFETLEEPNEVAASAGGLIGAWFVTAATAQSGFVDEYKQKYPGESIVTANNGYDSIVLLAKASAKEGSSSEVVEYLRQVKEFSGASGTFSATGDNRFTLPVTLKVIEANGFPEMKGGQR